MSNDLKQLQVQGTWDDHVIILIQNICLQFSSCRYKMEILLCYCMKL